MREDMAQVVVERPRTWRTAARHSARSWRRRFNDKSGFDDAADKAAINPYAERKHLDDHLGPLRRFLLSRCGKRWDNVWSEICARLKPTSVMQRHVLEHVRGYVEIDNLEIDERGDPWAFDAWRGRHRLVNHGPPQNFYVHPKTGHLRAAPQVARPRHRFSKDPQRRPRHQDGDDVYEKFGGLWFRVRHHRTDDGATIIIKDRQLSSKYLRRLGLQNDPPPSRV